jgi:hypothetical protein
MAAAAHDGMKAQVHLCILKKALLLHLALQGRRGRRSCRMSLNAERNCRP